MTKILIAEDSSLIQKLIRTIIEKEKNFEIVAVAGDGEDACKKVADLRPDIVLMDIRMPRMGGMDAIKKIMSETPTPIIVITSAEPANEIRAEAMKYGAVSFMEKPKALDYSAIGTKLISDIRTFSRLKLPKRTF